METVSTLFKRTIPNYLENLPIPDTFGGWFRLSFKDWLSLIPLWAAVGGVGFLTYEAVNRKPKGGSVINPNIHKENAKHVDILDIESLGDKTAICRCWRSKKFPYCDGSHNLFNETVGDNVGPCLIQKHK